MKISIIIAVYKDFQALNLILEQLRLQDHPDFEVIIAEDAHSKEIPKLIEQYTDLNIKHCYQEDCGIRKMRSQNNAIITSTGEYLIFIDGDCLPYPTFISSHSLCARPGYIASGRRVNVGPLFSKWIRNKKIKSNNIAEYFPLFFLPLVIDGKEGHIESGFCFNPNGFIYKNIISKQNRSTGILGCNFSCYKKDILAINGFDEGYGETAIGDDTDIEWRFKAYGLKMLSVKNVANVFHLYHEKRTKIIPNYQEMLELMEKRRKNNDYIASIGLNSHEI